MTAAEAKSLIPAFLDFVKTLQGEEKSQAQIFRALPPACLPTYITPDCIQAPQL